MNLNIKNSAVVDDVRTLAVLTGMSQTAAIGQAVRKELALLRGSSGDHMQKERAKRLLTSIRERTQGEAAPDHSLLLYSESGCQQ